jgi:ABC-2 type transport system ATP-binding protein
MIIETQNLTKKFGKHDAVSGISLSVPEGATVALIGANGAGKTTTLRMLMNLLEADAGRRGAGRRQPTPHRARYSRIGYVSENQKLPPVSRRNSSSPICGRSIPPGIAPSKTTCAAGSS